jgi:hypothetical protein
MRFANPYHLLHRQDGQPLVEGEHLTRSGNVDDLGETGYEPQDMAR